MDGIIQEDGNQTSGVCLIDMNDPEVSLKPAGNAFSGSGGRGGFSAGLGCFPGDSVVDVFNVSLVPTKDLKVSDLVNNTGENKHSKVYSFGHNDPLRRAEHVHIFHSNENYKPLKISKDHMLFVQREASQLPPTAIPASVVSAGDRIIFGSAGDFATVTKVIASTWTGAFAPFTLTGTIVVDEMMVSNCIALQQNSDALMIGTILSLSLSLC